LTPDEVGAHVARRAATLDRVRAMLVRQLRLRVREDEIDPDAPLFGSGLGLDSIDAVEVVVSLQTEFGVKLPEDRTATPLRTVNTLVDLVLGEPLG
jgi:acyl carrier protein